MRIRKFGVGGVNDCQILSGRFFFFFQKIKTVLEEVFHEKHVLIFSCLKDCNKFILMNVLGKRFDVWNGKFKSSFEEKKKLIKISTPSKMKIEPFKSLDNLPLLKIHRFDM